MELMTFSVENYLKPNNERLEKSNTLKSNRISSILESPDNKAQNKVEPKEKREFKSYLSQNTSSKQDVKKQTSKDDKIVTTDEEVEKKDSKLEEHPLFHINYLMKVEDIESPKVDTYVDSDNELISVETESSLDSTTIESSIDNISLESISVNEDNEIRKSEVLVENLSLEDELKLAFQETNDEIPVDVNNETLKLVGAYQDDSTLESVEEQNQNESFNVSKSSEVDLIETEVSMEDKPKPIRTTNESTDVEEDNDQAMTETHDKSFTIIDRKEVEFTAKSTVELENNELVKPKDMVHQIVEKFKIDLSQSKNEITVRLKPEILGDMTMSIEVVKDTVIAKVMVDNHRTKEIIEANLFQLKEGIKDTGIEIKTFEVFVGNNSDFDKHSSSQFNFNQNNKRVKFKSQKQDDRLIYEESIDNSRVNRVDPYSENTLNLFA